MKKTLSIAALTAILAGAAVPALAQEGTMSPPKATSEAPLTAPGGEAAAPVASATDIRAGALIGADVTNSAGEDIGKVTDLTIGDDHKVNAAIVSVGGILGVGDKLVAIALSDMSVTPDADGDLTVKVAASKDQLKAMPEVVLN
ncbi:PRC-barrel domain-containing protein [Zavarzinia sp.]|uniref:PRC-barrel domain-containing protein n=1 Tax=Zavarzinia sp. TaxID=2027920 RepID=UPI003BB6168B